MRRSYYLLGIPHTHWLMILLSCVYSRYRYGYFIGSCWLLGTWQLMKCTVFGAHLTMQNYIGHIIVFGSMTTCDWHQTEPFDYYLPSVVAWSEQWALNVCTHNAHTLAHISHIRPFSMSSIKCVITFDDNNRMAGTSDYGAFDWAQLKLHQIIPPRWRRSTLGEEKWEHLQHTDNHPLPAALDVPQQSAKITALGHINRATKFY